MSDDRREIALQALRAAGHDDAAALVEAIIPGGAPVAAPAAPAAGLPAAGLTPGQSYAQQQQLAAQVAAAGAPGQLTRAELDGMNQAQVVAYMNRPGGDDEVNRILREGA